MREMDIWVDFCRTQNIQLIEDCAQAHLAEWMGKKSGSFGIFGAFSFYPTKNLGAAGDAGMLITDNHNLANHAICLRNYGQDVRYKHPELGLNSRLDEMQAAILSEKVKWLIEFTKRRQKIADIYRTHIRNPLIQHLTAPEDKNSHVYHLYVIVCKTRGNLQKYLKNHQIQTLIHYPVCIHQQKPCLSIGVDPNGLGESEWHAKNCLSLPCHPQMSDSEVEYIVDKVNKYTGDR
jgi:dTDP-4-amino-4,6-dideoxygalactose transaminase